MNWSIFVIGAIGVAYVWLTQSAMSHLESDNRRLSDDLNTAIGVNKAFEQSLEVLNANYDAGLKALDTLKREKQKEVHYVTTIKEKIKEGQNATCMDAINAIYQRMRELDSSSPTASGSPAPRPNGGDSGAASDELGAEGKK